jgi:hypothetical protein
MSRASDLNGRWCWWTSLCGRWPGGSCRRWIGARARLDGGGEEDNSYVGSRCRCCARESVAIVTRPWWCLWHICIWKRRGFSLAVCLSLRALCRKWCLSSKEWKSLLCSYLTTRSEAPRLTYDVNNAHACNMQRIFALWFNLHHNTGLSWGRCKTNNSCIVM